jgi:hypothetical protein
MKPTQEDIDNVCVNLLGFKKTANGRAWDIGSDTGELYFLSQINPYTDDSLTGALVKAVFPILADRRWYLVPHPDGQWTIGEFHRSSDIVILTAPNLNTALIEAWKKIEGEKK